jgi:hypothetical protein
VWLRGYAPTTVPDDACYSIGALVADAVALHQALDGDGQAVLIGHDWGAEAAYDAAEEEAASHQAQQPTLYLHGSADGNIAVELVRGAERHLAPGSRMIVVEGAGHFPHYVCCRETGSGQGPGSGLRRGRGGGAGAAFAGGGGAGWLSAHVVADAGHDVAEVVQVVVGQGVEQQPAGDLDVTR